MYILVVVMEINFIGVSVLGLVGLDYSFGCGVLFVGFSWLLGGIYSVFFVVEIMGWL